MKRVINLDNWNRKEHFKFFSALDDPFWGITTTVDFTSIYQQSKNMEVSFFLYSVHFLLKCINATTAFKLRIENGEVVEYDKINISPTIGREDGTFGFGFFEYDTDLSLFIENAEKEIHRVKKQYRTFFFQGHSKSGCHPLFGSALVCLFRDETCRFNSNRRFYTQNFYR